MVPNAKTPGKAVDNIAQHHRLLLFKIEIKVTNILEMVNTAQLAKLPTWGVRIRTSDSAKEVSTDA